MKNYTATVYGSVATNMEAGLIGPTNRNGAVLGSFYGPSAQETGGTFGIHSTSGPKYLASGIFAGR